MIRTLIVDDQNIIREGLKVLLENTAEIEIVGYAEDGESAIQKVESAQPDIVLLDINLPGINGLTVAELISNKFPQVKVIMLSSYEDNSYLIKAMESSAKGYLLKSVSSQELEWSIKLVHQGYSAFKSELLETLITNDKSLTEHTVSENSAKNIDNIPVKSASISPTLAQKQGNTDKLELLLAKNQLIQKYSSYKQQSPRKQKFNSVKVNKAKKTINSFEFKLLVFTILFSLGFLIFIALA